MNGSRRSSVSEVFGKVFSGLAAARDHLAEKGLPKDQRNEQQKFMFRGIDPLYGILQPALKAGGLVMMPNVLTVDRKEYQTVNREGTPRLQFYTVVQVEYHFVSLEDGSETAYTYAGEAADTGDKSLSKALTMAFKSFCFHVFQIPLNGTDDADQHVADTTAPPPLPEDIKAALTDAAAESKDALKAAWRELSPETRELVTKFHADFWAGLKGSAK
jgi:hypothetical protein